MTNWNNITQENKELILSTILKKHKEDKRKSNFTMLEWNVEEGISFEWVESEKRLIVKSMALFNIPATENSKAYERRLSMNCTFTCAYKTPKGYVSSKDTGVTVVDPENPTSDEVNSLLQFNTDAVHNTFDPFYAENQASLRNASAWAHIATNYLQPDVSNY